MRASTGSQQPPPPAISSITGSFSKNSRAGTHVRDSRAGTHVPGLTCRDLRAYVPGLTLLPMRFFPLTSHH